MEDHATLVPRRGRRGFAVSQPAVRADGWCVFVLGTGEERTRTARRQRTGVVSERRHVRIRAKRGHGRDRLNWRTLPVLCETTDPLEFGECPTKIERFGSFRCIARTSVTAPNGPKDRVSERHMGLSLLHSQTRPSPSPSYMNW